MSGGTNCRSLLTVEHILTSRSANKNIREKHYSNSQPPHILTNISKQHIFNYLSEVLFLTKFNFLYGTIWPICGECSVTLQPSNRVVGPWEAVKEQDVGRVSLSWLQVLCPSLGNPWHCVSRNCMFYAQLGDFAECKSNHNKETFCETMHNIVTTMNNLWSLAEQLDLLHKIPKTHFTLLLRATNWIFCWLWKSGTERYNPLRPIIKSETEKYEPQRFMIVLPVSQFKSCTHRFNGRFPGEHRLGSFVSWIFPLCLLLSVQPVWIRLGLFVSCLTKSFDVSALLLHPPPSSYSMWHIFLSLSLILHCRHILNATAALVIHHICCYFAVITIFELEQTCCCWALM